MTTRKSNTETMHIRELAAQGASATPGPTPRPKVYNALFGSRSNCA